MPVPGDGRSGTLSATVTQFGGYKRGATPATPPLVGQTRIVRQRYPDIATLADDFATQDTAKWAYDVAATATGGQLVLTPNTSFTGSIVSRAAYDLTGSQVGVQLVQRANVGNGGTESYLIVYRDNPNGDGLLFDVVGSVLRVGRRVGGAQTNMATPTFDPVAHAWWRISESAGTVSWETSPDRSTWTSQATWVATFPVTSMFVTLGSGFSGTEPAPGTVIFDNVNTVPSVGGSGALAATPATLSGSGGLTVTGSGALATQPATLSGAGTLTLTGSGTLAATPATLAGSGTVKVTGTGGLAATPATLSGAGTLALTGTGAVAATPTALSGTGTATVTGTGGLTATSATLSGAGTITGPVTGTGSLAATPATVSGAGALTTTGTGGLAATPATLAAAGTLTAAGAGALTATPATLTGSGTVTAAGAVSGTGALAATPAGLSGVGVLVVVGAAALNAQAATLAAAGLVTSPGITGGGALTAPTAGLAGAGTVTGGPPGQPRGTVTLTASPAHTVHLNSGCRFCGLQVDGHGLTLTGHLRS